MKPLFCAQRISFLIDQLSQVVIDAGRHHLGIAGQPVVLPEKQRGGTGRDRGVLVVGVTPDGPAAAGGVLVGDVVRFLTRLVRMGRTSITMDIRVEAERGQEIFQVTEAEVVYVAVDAGSADRHPKPLLGEPAEKKG